ncbi:threonylcarbamoyl-AMP synthase [Listeria newyorkensis]|uniref:Threonylcarbamoyl-AMP synthase n=1 Tax=Listeria newyorkensis TaxID=1497681 RepID=A0ABX4XL92_9LIST|nr:L-threonylcarbamoyladenylate synthase [Listeria newyorkensis]KGL45812.1 tRNA threonylcarbamoyladenosine biosynthesis protein [Listeria newyorkensis]KMT58170.1 translation factor, SUA5 type [Listeria newyorkensis]PNP90258.1 threonylcarbamoyl-AMP synthase [Listeria newyorkensis]WAO22165.1 L-threonylcarbamoyladenylate synthase [Listeria newyorkensis]SQC52271.1 t(6)A37 threonylcarbamoyladenosine biosynthesis protein RimN [Listeria newyorkensis]
METKIWHITKENEIQTYLEAAKLLQAGETVAFPTETVYGIGADATNEQAVAKIYEAKGRPSDNPLIVHIADQSQIHEFVQKVPSNAKKLMREFWPGPLTIILPLQPGRLATNVTAGLDSVGVRMPEHPVALGLLAVAGIPVAAPSANRSGKPSPTSGEHVEEDLSGRIAGIVFGGKTGVGLESTVIDCTLEIPAILRPGGVSQEEIEAVIGSVISEAKEVAQQEAPKAPGMKYTHYAPKAPVAIIEGDAAFFQKQIDLAEKRGEIVGVLVSDELEAQLRKSDYMVGLGSKAYPEEVAYRLYDRLRHFDHTPVTLIYAEPFAKTGIGEAVMNRLDKAAGGHYIKQSEER